MYLVGRVATNDNTAIPNDTVVQRVCNGKVRQQVYELEHGDFNMQLGARLILSSMPQATRVRSLVRLAGIRQWEFPRVG